MIAGKIKRALSGFDGLRQGLPARLFVGVGKQGILDILQRRQHRGFVETQRLFLQRRLDGDFLPNAPAIEERPRGTGQPLCCSRTGSVEVGVLQRFETD